MLTIDQVKLAVPTTLKNSVTQQMVDTINNIATDPDIAEQIRNNFISYTSVLKDGKFKTEDYVNAVTYVSFKLMNMSNQEAYFRTFPAKHQSMIARGLPAKDIAANVASYNKGKLVNLILEQTIVPTWVMNHDLHQKAINVLADMMNVASSDKVKVEAANALLNHLTKPKEVGPLINLDLRDNSGMSELKKTLHELASQQQELMKSGVSVKAIAEHNIIDVVATDAVT